jgi:hypothetical protein
MSSFGTKLEEVIEEGIVDEVLHNNRTLFGSSLDNVKSLNKPAVSVLSGGNEQDEMQAIQVKEQLEEGEQEKQKSEAEETATTMELLVTSVSHTIDGPLESGWA